MAHGIELAIDEVTTVVTAFTGISTFIYGERSEINYNDKDASFPKLLIDSRDVDVTVLQYDNNYLPKKNTIVLKAEVTDLYKESERQTKDQQQKQGEVVILMEQLLAELIRRSRAGDNRLNFKSIKPTGFVADKAHSDNLMKCEFIITVDTMENNCTTGTFSY